MHLFICGFSISKNYLSSIQKKFKGKRGFLVWSVVFTAWSCGKTSFFFQFLCPREIIFFLNIEKPQMKRCIYRKNASTWRKRQVYAREMSGFCSHHLARKLKKFLNHRDLHHPEVFFLIFGFWPVFRFPVLSATSLCISPHRRFRQEVINVKVVHH